ncbi:hypothetical protein [Alteromonas sp. C1M14]|uniref:hypothetical protein n=1 Tax=Alteromonas sp. C1M14 TaxID=2841567 RepID=UPI001C0837F9|nr:hypothetical protein [Alteromonas sp. C1M14]MBU2976869.1 hypothetical protein [Alteromonas sp. C1M14]
MTCEIDTKHAKLLIEILQQSDQWILQPEKKSPFESKKAAYAYLETNNEPLYIRVPITNSDEQTYVRVSSAGDDLEFQTVGFDNVQKTKLHHSHLKLIESTVTDMVNAQLPAGQKAASF